MLAPISVRPIYAARQAQGGGIPPVEPVAAARSATAAPQVSRPTSAAQAAGAANQIAAAAPQTAAPLSAPASSGALEQGAARFSIPDAQDSKYLAPELAVRGRIEPYKPQAQDAKNVAEQAEKAPNEATGLTPKELLETMDEAKCQTCADRKYQDGSDDASVSFQNPQSIDPSMVTSRVRGHEMEHVRNNQADAKQEGRKVVSQSVSLHSAICPECGKAYTSGGTTKTVTKSDNAPKFNQDEEAATSGSIMNLVA